jgi:RNA polymerase sigma factor (sigma-70 family)
MRHHGEVWPDEDELVCLVREAQGGAPSAVDAFLARVRPSFLAFFEPSVGADAAEDLAQDALIRTARSLRAIRPERARAYLVTMVRNLLRSERRSRARDVRLRAALAGMLEEPANPDPEVEYSDRVDGLCRATLAALSPKLRDTMLGVLAGLTPSAVAAREGVPAEVIRTRLRRARACLRVALGRDREGRGANGAHPRHRRSAPMADVTLSPIPEYGEMSGPRPASGDGRSPPGSRSTRLHGERGAAPP